MEWCFFREREWNGRWRNKWRARGATPCHGAAWPGLHHHVVWWHGGSPWVVPSASLPHFRLKKLINIFWNFLRNFVFEDFQKLTNN
jgi:hypothetical protein